ncbi:MAG: protein-L-isoaspartate(D-aspartate) O-methyltransferase [Candidatus Saganbacteria bacterium]|nr:protein-L-isoaspartate(D-aspartate) O-methyltransferase [Candidatus Saganbacteria bacterium]
MNNMKKDVFGKLRDEMVEAQLIARGISDMRVLEAMRKVERHSFVPENIRDSAYDDCALPIGNGQTISQPYMVAAMTECLRLKGGEKVLEVGTGSGYQAAILSLLSVKVFTVERLGPLADRASKILADLGYNNVDVIVGDGTAGFTHEAPYDAIIVTAGCPSIPKPLVNQLSDGGRLVIPVGDQFRQILTIVIKGKNTIETEESISCVFVPLIGKYGWKDRA